MKTISVVALSALGAAAGGWLLPEPPPLRLYLEHGGQQMDVRIDRPFELEVGGEKVSLTLRARPTRIFDIGEVRFEYPKDYVYELDDETQGVEIACIEGSDAICMINRYTLPLMSKAEVFDMIVESVEGQLGSGSTTKACETTFGELRLEGQRVTFSIGDFRVLQDYYLLPTSGSGAVVLMLQDTVDAEIGQTQTDGYRQLLELLDKTLQVK